MYTHKQVQLVVRGGGVGGGVSKCSPPADFKLPATPRKNRGPQDDGLYIYKCVCVCVSRSCLAHTRADMCGVLVMYTHKQVQLLYSGGGGGLGEAFLSPADVKIMYIGRLWGGGVGGGVFTPS